MWTADFAKTQQIHAMTSQQTDDYSLLSMFSFLLTFFTFFSTAIWWSIAEIIRCVIRQHLSYNWEKLEFGKDFEYSQNSFDK